VAPRLAVLVACVALAVAGCTGSGDNRVAQPDDGLLAQLRDGGLTIVIRHAATDQSRPDAPTVVLDDCATQRNLSGQGREDARAIGTAVDRLDIPVGEIWASPYCRSRDTAELAFGRFEVVPGLERLYPERDHHADQHLNQLIGEQAPRAGEPNLVIASHGVYPSVLVPAVPLAEGEAALYARTNGEFELAGRIMPDEWATLDSGAVSPAVATAADSVVALDGPGGTGSAFRVAMPGILVTSAHLVADASEVTVTLRDGERRTARVLGSDPEVDIAALRIADDSALPPLHSGSGLSEARTGDAVFAIGGGGAVTAGVLSKPRDPLEAVRTDAELPRDSVGGPLVDDDGNVLGVLTTTGGIAIPVDVARAAATGIVRDNP
jgi:broad specificity phosphatase PhoE